MDSGQRSAKGKKRGFHQEGAADPTVPGNVQNHPPAPNCTCQECDQRHRGPRDRKSGSAGQGKAKQHNVARHIRSEHMPHREKANSVDDSRYRSHHNQDRRGCSRRIAHSFLSLDNTGWFEVAPMNRRPPQIATFFEKLMS